MATVTGVEVRNVFKNGVGTAFSPKRVWENHVQTDCLLRQQVLFIPE